MVKKGCLEAFLWLIWWAQSSCIEHQYRQIFIEYLDRINVIQKWMSIYNYNQLDSFSEKVDIWWLKLTESLIKLLTQKVIFVWFFIHSFKWLISFNFTEILTTLLLLTLWNKSFFRDFSSINFWKLADFL